ncbi:hypothetical protein LguiB_027243 [Lonicera macranthoides]
MAPSYESELIDMVATTAVIDDQPSGFRGRMKREGSRVAILGFGTMVQNCLKAAELLQVVSILTIVADARFCKPLDGNLVRQLAQEYEFLV